MVEKILNTGLVLYLPLYERDGNQLLSADAHAHLCAVTGAARTLQGSVFDGIDDMIIVPNSLPLQLTEALTLGLWVYVNPLSAVLNGNVKYLLDNGSSVGQGFNIYWEDRGDSFGTNRMNFRVYGSISGVSSCLLDSESFPAARWYHLTCTYDKASGKQEFYVDGVLQKTVNFSETMVAPTNNLYIGSSIVPGSWGEWVIGEIRLYGRALTPAEIQSNFLTTKWRYV